MTRDARLAELGAFLRARRAEAAAPAGSGRRRVSGLRRGEVAERAFVSEEYYTRIEQGRVAPGLELLERIGAVLGLDGDQAAYGRALLEGRGSAPSAGVDDALVRLVDHLGPVPAAVVGPDTAVLAWNPALAELLIDFASVPAAERLFVRLLFTDPQLQSCFVDLEGMRRTVVGIVRTSAPSGIPTGAWIDELADISEEFAALWRRADAVRPHVRIRVALRGSDGAVAECDQVVLQAADDPHHRLVVFVPVA